MNMKKILIIHLFFLALINYGLTIEKAFLLILTLGKSIVSSISSFPWFYNSTLSRKNMCSFSRLRFGHTLLPSSLALKQTLSKWLPICTHHNYLAIWNILHIHFNCPFIFSQRLRFLSLINLLNILLYPQSIFSSNSHIIITIPT